MKFNQLKLFIAAVFGVAVLSSPITTIASPGYDPATTESNSPGFNPAFEFFYEKEDTENKENEEETETTEDTLINEVIDTEWENAPEYRKEEVDELKKTVMAEGGYTEPDHGIRLMTDVILNRKDHEDFPDTITEVIEQPYQFSSKSDGNYEKYGPQVTDRVDRIVEEELFNRTDYDVLFFTAGKYNPYSTPMFQVGNHYFGK